VFVGELAGDLVAALSLADGCVTAGRFEPTAALLEHLQHRAAELRSVARDPRRGQRPLAGLGVAVAPRPALA
jgi:hypothetical protein